MMPRYFLTRLAVSRVSAASITKMTHSILSFEPNSVNSVYAFNGIGKSSIFEALYYAISWCHPEAPELLQAQERPQDYYCNRFHSKNAASILVEFQPDDRTAPISIQIDRDVSGNRTVTSPSGHA